MSKNGFIYGLVLGGAIGFGAGLLFAPRTGAETRAVLTDRVDEVWGQGQDFYEKNVRGIGQKAAEFIPNSSNVHTDELRDKIDIARTRIAEQVAKNAESARGYVDDTVKPFVAKVVSRDGDNADAADGDVEQVEGVAGDDAAEGAAAEETDDSASGTGTNPGMGTWPIPEA
jgi:gas vesicle protein